VEKSDIHSTGSESLAAFIDDATQKEPDNKRSPKLKKYFQGCGADGDLSCTAKDTCLVEWNDETTCNLSFTMPLGSPPKNEVHFCRQLHIPPQPRCLNPLLSQVLRHGARGYTHMTLGRHQWNLDSSSWKRQNNYHLEMGRNSLLKMSYMSILSSLRPC